MGESIENVTVRYLTKHMADVFISFISIFSYLSSTVAFKRYNFLKQNILRVCAAAKDVGTRPTAGFKVWGVKYIFRGKIILFLLYV